MTHSHLTLLAIHGGYESNKLGRAIPYNLKAQFVGEPAGSQACLATESSPGNAQSDKKLMQSSILDTAKGAKALYVSLGRMGQGQRM